jgi:hypothetical protein
MTFQEKTNWFNNNFKAVPTNNPLGNCSACVFRNFKPYCLKVSCSYLDMHKINSIYWESKNNLGFIGAHEMYDFFNNTDRHDIKEISIQAMKTAFKTNTK